MAVIIDNIPRIMKKCQAVRRGAVSSLLEDLKNVDFYVELSNKQILPPKS